MKPLKQRFFEIHKSGRTQTVFVYFGVNIALLNHGRQLFVIAYEDKFANCIGAGCVASAQYAQQVRFQYLSSLINNCHVKGFKAEQFGFGGYGSHCPHKYPTGYHALYYFRSTGAKRQLILHQVISVSGITR
ncbi:hypothetical protein SDC9_80981 [bioreactor metagenome]|uniref:Uncharacterized protein n=1 Tax=bioreactor metagenome TaxID=1076179 RepID=A0A644Z290_9ZZZZ